MHSGEESGGSSNEGAPIVIRGSDEAGAPSGTRFLTDEPINVRDKFCRSYERWVLSMEAFGHDWKGHHIINDAWEEYCIWRDMWCRS